ncbi:MAG: DNA-directed RNA polymerase subunit omega [Verrucomicrobiota bacterium]|nr:DNA-directed RNA polymerase subunit omega [Verrucomicrobiota bacterium]MEC8244239.1 DNA-directed RNA polymerase subunit omega [Verrucomicrobiota bacterium]
MRDEYLKEAQQIVNDPNTLINMVSRRSKQLKHGSKPLVESLEKLEPEDIALKEIIEGKISYQAWQDEEES